MINGILGMASELTPEKLKSLFSGRKKQQLEKLEASIIAAASQGRWYYIATYCEYPSLSCMSIKEYFPNLKVGEYYIGEIRIEWGV